MEERKTLQQWLTAYSDENLHRISCSLIELYRSKQYAMIKSIANAVSTITPLQQGKDSKRFSSLIMLYHPDKGEHIRTKISEIYKRGDEKLLAFYSHIFLLENMDDFVAHGLTEEIDFTSEYVWETPDDGYSEINDYEDYMNERGKAERYNEASALTFFDALKMRMYGDIDIDFPSYYLEDYYEVELADSGIMLLDGVEFCIHAITLDLSGNEITDISRLTTLINLEEIDLSNNQIGYIDALSNLVYLKRVDLADNEIDDIVPLLFLENLTYVNLTGNPVSKAAIRELEKIGVEVIY